MYKRVAFFFLLGICTTIRGQVYNIHQSPLNLNLLQNSISGISKDDKGFLWIITQFGIYRYDGKNIEQQRYTANGLIKSSRFTLFFTVTGQKKLYTINEEKLYSISEGKLNEEYLPSNTYMACSKGAAYIGLNKNINPTYLSDDKKDNVTILSQIYFFPHDTILGRAGVFYDINTRSFLKQKKYNNFYVAVVARNHKNFEIQKDGIYAVTYQNGLLQYKKVATTGPETELLNLAETGFWVRSGTRILHFDENTETISETLELARFNLESVSYFFENDKNVYIGTSTMGIYEGLRFKGKILIPDSQAKKQQPIYSYSYDKVYDKYYTIGHNGFYELPLGKGKNEKTALPEKEIFISSCCVDNNHHAWFADCTSHNLYDFDLHQKKILTTYSFSSDIAHIRQFEGPYIYASDTYHFYSINPADKKIQLLYATKGNNKILSFNFSNNKYYIGTEDGMIVLNQYGHEIAHLLRGNFVRYILPYNNNNLVAGTYGNGTFVLQKDSIYHLPTDRHLINNAVVALSKDRSGDLWILCNKGAFILNHRFLENISASFRDITYDLFLQTTTELPAAELNGSDMPTVFPDDNICLPSSEGLIVFKKSYFLPQRHPALNLKSVYVDDIKMNYSNRNIPANHNNIRFSIDIPYYVSDNNLNLLYRIRGLDDKWQPLNLDRTISLNKLVKGSYRLEIKYYDQTNPVLVSSFSVLPYWYQTVYFYIVLGFLFFAILFFTLKIRTASLVKRKEILENQVYEKTEQLQQNLQALTKSRKKIFQLYHNSNKLYAVLMHDLKSPLLFLSNFTIDLYQQTRQHKQLDEKAVVTIADTSASLYKFTTDFLFWLQQQNREEMIHVDKFDINTAIHDIVSFYSKICLINENKLVFFPQQTVLFMETDQELIKVVVRNLLDNANKYSKNGVIKIDCGLSEDEKNVVIEIQDSGNGMPEHIVNLFHESISIDPETISIKKNYKMGVLITKEFVQILQGSLSVTSNEEAGTSFNLVFPVIYNNHVRKDDTY